MKKAPGNEKQTVTTNDIMDFLVEHMATKEELRYEVSQLRKEMATKDDLGKLKSEMIDYIAKQMNELKIDLSTLIRQNDRKVTLLLDILLANKIITPAQAKKVHALSLA